MPALCLTDLWTYVLLGYVLVLLIRFYQTDHIDEAKRHSNICQRNLGIVVSSWAKKGPALRGLHSACLVCSTRVPPILALMLTPNLSSNHGPQSFTGVAMATSLHEIACCANDYRGES